MIPLPPSVCHQLPPPPDPLCLTNMELALDDSNVKSTPTTPNIVEEVVQCGVPGTSSLSDSATNAQVLLD